MEFLTQLWLPILLSAVFVFIVSSVVHMVLPYHRSDVKKIKHEDAVLDSMRTNSVDPGAYMFPMPDSMKEMGSPEMCEKYKRGPVGYLIVLPAGGFNMGRSLALWFAYCILIGLLVAYVGWHGLGAGAGYLSVFQLTGAAAVLGFTVGVVNDSIWKGQRWGTTAKFVFDGLAYALVTAGTFGWLWPRG
ncbi:MAG: hypothetical protein ACYTGP_03285 [Planctomycetota bacterium]|jgi:hypothetical protein